MLAKFIQLPLFFRPPPPMIEPTSLVNIWNHLIDKYFPARQDLKSYRIVWSNKKQTRSLASCSVEKRVVRVAKAMSLTSSRPYLEALIYHEMCHAVLGPPKIVKGRRIMHGKDFKAIEKLHPEIKLLDIWIKSGGWDKAVRTCHRSTFF